jgi:MoaA/NifB/PqqE/SkfB family radical SAM enzyme
MGMTYIMPRSKVLWHLDHLKEMQRGLRPMPLGVEIDLSNRCSLGCEWCHFSHTHTKGPLANSPKLKDRIPGGDLMETGLAYEIIEQLKEAGVKSIIWTGGGEPTLHPHFDMITRYAWGRIDQGLYTHGGHIDEERAAHLKEVLTWVYVSLDASNAESYKKAKGIDRFEDACNGVRLMAEAKGNATIGAGFLVTAENFQDIEQMVRLARDLGADYAAFRPTILYDLTRPGEVTEDTEWLSEAMPAMELLAADPFVSVDLDRFRMYADWDGHGYEKCWWSGIQACITPNGKVWPCINKREFPGTELGDLNNERFDRIWKSSGLHTVNDVCRAMCRGHLPNLTLEKVMSRPQHENFV